MSKVPEVLQMVLEDKEEKSRKGSKHNWKFDEKGRQSNETKSDGGTNLHEGFMKTNQFRKLQCRREYGETQHVFIVRVYGGRNRQSYVGIAFGQFNEL